MTQPGNSALIVFTTTHHKETSTHPFELHEWASKVLNRLEENGLARIANHSVLLYESDEEHVLIYSMTDLEELSSLETNIKGLKISTPTVWCLYHQLALPLNSSLTSLESSPVPAASPHILILNGMTPLLQLEMDFNNWYSEEHIPMLSRAPGWIYSKRYRLVVSSEEAPQYLAVHAWENVLSFASAPYKAAISTPWRTAVVDKVIARERRVVRFVQEL